MKRIGILSLQVLVTGIGLWYVFHDPQRRAQIADALRHASISWIILGLVCYSAVEILATVRWQILLRLQGIRLRWLQAGGIVMIGLFFSLFLPGGIGGDAMRVYFMFQLAPRRKIGATLSIVMDRLFGLFTVLFLAGMSISLRFSWLTRSGTSRHIAYLAFVLLGGSLAFVVLVFWLANSSSLYRLPKALPLRKVVVQSGEALLRYRSQLGVMTLVFVITIVAHLAYYTNYYCAGEALRMSKGHAASLADILSIMPLVDTIISMPISIGGLGLRETLFQELLGNLAHVPPALAAFTASLGYAIQVFWGLVGAAIFLASQKFIHR
jgi:glycosyltransferase 2 family protein